MEAARKSFDSSQVVTTVLSYVQYGRIMVAMACMGILAGICYFVYATPIYSTRAVIYFRIHGAPISDRGVAETMLNPRSARSLPGQLVSKRNVLAAAKRAGLVDSSASYEDVSREHLKARAFLVDASHLELSVDSKDPEVARNFCKLLVEEYTIQMKESWAQYREQALVRYAEEVKALDQHAMDSLKELSGFERDGKLTEAAIEQSRVNMIPEELAFAREMVSRMQQVQKQLESIRAKQGNAGVFGVDEVLVELSLLTAFEKEREVKVGDIVRRQANKGPLVTPLPTGTVIVQPDMVEGLHPWQELEKSRRLLLDQIALASQNYLPEHRIRRELEERLKQNEQSLHAELQVVRQRFDLELQHFQTKQANLEDRLAEYHTVNEKMGLADHDYERIERGKGLWQRARDLLADRLAAVSFSEDQDWTELRFKEYVSLRDEDPVSPGKLKLFLMSIWLAIGGAVGVPTLLKFMSSGVSTLNQLEGVTGIPAIGVIPQTPTHLLEDIVRSPAIGSKVPNHLLECFRLIRGHILLHPNPKGKSQVIMVTSARPSEGKTSQAANLAWAFQSLGARTLLIDCDLRRGRMHQIVNIMNEPGMTQLLMKRCEVNDVVSKTENALLDVIPRGPVNVGVTEILSQKSFEELIAYFRTQYDQIILDTPPLLGLSETASIQRVADGVVMVVRAEKTPKKDVLDAVRMLRQTNAHLFGMVLNGLDLSKLGNYYNYYYYSASYYEDVAFEKGAAA
jgi:succinoglycan biosynthesis transport protein ExoP